MKKIIGASAALLVLTSCGTPTVENPNNALQQTQSALIENVEKLQKLTPEQSKSIWTASVQIEAKEGKANLDFWYNFESDNTTYEHSGNLDIDVKIEANDPILSEMNFIGKINLDLITLKNKFFFKLNELTIDETSENNQLSLITGFTHAFKNNWYFIENLFQNPVLEIQQDYFTKQKEVVSLLKSHTLLSHISTNKNTDFYDYEVNISDEALVNFIIDLEKIGQTEENLESIITQSEIDAIKTGVADFNSVVQTNIKIDKSNLEYFILTFSHIDGSVIIENSKDNFNITMNDSVEKITALLLGTKWSTQFDAKISVIWESSESENIQLLDGSMSLKTNGKETNMTLDMVMKDEYTHEDFKINIILNDQTIANEISIEEPNNAQNFEEIIQQLTWGFIWSAIWIESDINPEINN